ncbi:MAG TPA: extracellular solute-binding protein [Chloroflexia bacterium]|nr:extracellular solute-binding protein [Chloroflexia bacterium]
MAFIAARRAPSPPVGETSLLRQGLTLTTGSILVGVGVALLLTGAQPLLGGLILLAGGGLAGAGGLGLWRASRALQHVMTMLQGAGDLTLLPTTADLPADSPLSPLAVLLARMGQAVRQLVRQLQLQADQVRNGALLIGHAVDQQNSEVAGQAAAISEVAAAMAQLEQIMAHVTATAHEVALAAQEVLAASTSSRSVVEAAVLSLDQTRERVGKTLAAMEILRARATQIGVISDLISEVADHTHILALNAAIEAAGAGESGRRFSVVAVEVRTLALRTREGGREVGELVQELEQATAATLDAAQAGLDQTTQTAQLTATLTGTSEQLAATAERTQRLAAAIDRAMSQQRTSAGEVARALTQISDSAAGMRSQTAAMAGEARELIDVARQLRGSALRFGVNEPRRGRLRLLIAGRETVSSRGLAWHSLVDAWNQAHPDAILALEFLPPSADYDLELERQFAAGQAPDLLQVISGTHFARLGCLAPLDALLTPAVRQDFYPAVLAAGSYQGRIYSLPTEALPMLLLYNKRLFAELGLAVPRTWAELIDVGRRCRAANRWGLILETTPGEFRAKQWLPFMWQGGAAVPDAQDEVHLEQPAVQAAIQLWRDLLVTHQIAPVKLPHPWYEIANLIEGHCAMQYIGSWGLIMARDSHPDFPFGVMDLPLPPGGQPATMLLGFGLAVNAHSPQRDLAGEFIRWALADEGPEGVRRVHSLMVEGPPVRRSVVAQVEQDGPVDPAWRVMLEQIYPHARFGPEWPAEVSTVIDSALGDAIADL